MIQQKILAAATIGSVAQAVAMKLMLKTVYYAGYLMRKVLEIFGCIKCSENFVYDDNKLSDKKQLYLLYKNYNTTQNIVHLHVPIKPLTYIIKLNMKTFEKH